MRSLYIYIYIYILTKKGLLKIMKTLHEEIMLWPEASLDSEAAAEVLTGQDKGNRKRGSDHEITEKVTCRSPSSQFQVT